MFGGWGNYLDVMFFCFDNRTLIKLGKLMLCYVVLYAIFCTNGKTCLIIFFLLAVKEFYETSSYYQPFLKQLQYLET